jgi:hypothetical protein
MGFENIISEVNWKYKALGMSGKLIIEMFGSENLGNPTMIISHRLMC